MPSSKSGAAAPKKRAVKSSPAKKTKAPTKRKARPVIVDVISDEELEKMDSHFPAVPKMEAMLEEEAPRAEEIDQQKKFFSEIVSEISQEKGRPAPARQRSAKASGRVSFYRRLAWQFFALVVVVALGVMYFFSSKLTITITPKGESLNDTLFLKVSSATSSEASLLGDPRATVSGEVKELEISVEANYPASGEEFGGEAISGRVRIINNYNKSQALVATTRLLSPDNKLYRIKEAVNVPAGGEAEVEIYADKPGPDMAIAPTTFTIPGLWIGLQDKIYAKNDSAFVFERESRRYVKASDLQLASQEIKAKLLEEAAKSPELSGSSSWLFIASEPATVDLDAKIDDAKDEFQAKASGTVIAVSFSRDEAAKLAGAKLKLLVPDNKELIGFNPDQIVYAFDSYNEEDKTATIKATFSGLMILKGDSEIIDRKHLVNLKKEQIADYLDEFPEISGYELRFSPAFVSKAPNLVDRIKVEISK